MLTNKDKEWIEDKIKTANQDTVRLLVTYVQSEIHPLKEKIEHLPTREEMYSIRDEILSVFHKQSEEHEALMRWVKDHELRIYKLEKAQFNT